MWQPLWSQPPSPTQLATASASRGLCCELLPCLAVLRPEAVRPPRRWPGHSCQLAAARSPGPGQGSRQRRQRACDGALARYTARAAAAGSRPHDPASAAVVVIGGGAAGLFAACTAGRRGRRVIVLERNSDIGKKIKISGGGRCNFTNISPDLLAGYHSSGRAPGRDAAFREAVLERYRPEEFIALVEAHGICYHEKKLGQLFCDGSAQQIVEMLRSECQAVGVDIHTGCTVRDVLPAEVAEEASTPGRPRFFIDYDRSTPIPSAAALQISPRSDGRGETCGDVPVHRLPADAVIVASGGLSWAKTCGSTDLSHRLAERFGLPLRAVRPGLVPLVFHPAEEWLRTELTAVAMEVRASVPGGPSFLERLLITHRGMSGPVMLQISSYWDYVRQEPITFDLVPTYSEPQLVGWLRRYQADNPRLEARVALRKLLPNKRFADAFWAGAAAPLCGVGADALLSDIEPKQPMRRVAELLKKWEVRFSGTEGYPKAEVTCGGLSTDALSPETMEVRDRPGLFFAGEAVDVTGWLGGYNFQWAWASAHAAGLAC